MDIKYNFRIAGHNTFLVYGSNGSKLVKSFSDPAHIIEWAKAENVNGRRFDTMFNRFVNLDRTSQVTEGMSVKHKTIERGTVLSNPDGSGETYVVGSRGRPPRWVSEMLNDQEKADIPTVEEPSVAIVEEPVTLSE
jgi:hypothetical protein